MQTTRDEIYPQIWLKKLVQGCVISAYLEAGTIVTMVPVLPLTLLSLPHFTKVLYTFLAHCRNTRS